MTTIHALSEHPLTTGGRAAAHWWAAASLSAVATPLMFFGLFLSFVFAQTVTLPVTAVGLLAALGVAVTVRRLRAAAALHTPGALGQAPARWRVTGQGAARVLVPRLVLDLPLWLLMLVLLNHPTSSQSVAATEVTIATAYGATAAGLAAVLFSAGVIADVAALADDWPRPARRMRLIETGVNATGPGVLLVLTLAALPVSTWLGAVEIGLLAGVLVGAVAALPTLERLRRARMTTTRTQPLWLTRIAARVTALVRPITAPLDAAATAITHRVHDLPTTAEHERTRSTVYLIAAAVLLAFVLVARVLWGVLV